MIEKWKNINKLRETTIKISGSHYSGRYAEKTKIIKHGNAFYYNETEKLKTVFVPEMIEVRLNENDEVEYNNLEIGSYYEKPKERFETSAGVFICHNRGEFGGELITPKETIYGNFTDVFECDKLIYAIDSLNHMGCAHTKIYSFSKKLHSKIIYSSKNIKLDSWKELSDVDFKALYIKTDTVYVLVSELRRKDDANFEKSYLFEIRKGKIVNEIIFDFYFWHVKNMLINNGKMILGMDKVVAIVDIVTKDIKAYTSISIESEIDILETLE